MIEVERSTDVAPTIKLLTSTSLWNALRGKSSFAVTVRVKDSSTMTGFLSISARTSKAKALAVLNWATTNNTPRTTGIKTFAIMDDALLGAARSVDGALLPNACGCAVMLPGRFERDALIVRALRALHQSKHRRLTRLAFVTH